MRVCEFCTCDNDVCPYRYDKNDGHCDTCIKANLDADAIPRCFYYKAGCAPSDIKTSSFVEFAGCIVEKTFVK